MIDVTVLCASFLCSGCRLSVEHVVDKSRSVSEQLLALQLENQRLQDELINLHETNTDMLQLDTIQDHVASWYQCRLLFATFQLGEGKAICYMESWSQLTTFIQFLFFDVPAELAR